VGQSVTSATRPRMKCTAFVQQPLVELLEAFPGVRMSMYKLKTSAVGCASRTRCASFSEYMQQTREHQALCVPDRATRTAVDDAHRFRLLPVAPDHLAARRSGRVDSRSTSSEVNTLGNRPSR